MTIKAENIHYYSKTKYGDIKRLVKDRIYHFVVDPAYFHTKDFNKKVNSPHVLFRTLMGMVDEGYAELLTPKITKHTFSIDSCPMCGTGPSSYQVGVKCPNCDYVEGEKFTE